MILADENLLYELENNQIDTRQKNYLEIARFNLDKVGVSS